VGPCFRLVFPGETGGTATPSSTRVGLEVVVVVGGGVGGIGLALYLGGLGLLVY
jgi:hypothetical protein